VHLVTAGIIVAFVLLGRWQWHRYHATDSLQYFSYALQWPLFAAFVGFFWWRLMRSELHPPEEPEPAPQRHHRTPAPAVAPTTASDEPDDELAAYNRYLAGLAGRDHCERGESTS